MISYVNAILTPSDFKRCLRPISPYFFVTVASRSCINFVFESKSNQFFLFCQVAILCWVPSTFASSVMCPNAHLSGLILNWKMDGLLDWNQNGKWTSNWDELKLENGQATGLESGVHIFFWGRIVNNVRLKLMIGCEGTLWTLVFGSDTNQF